MKRAKKTSFISLYLYVHIRIKLHKILCRETTTKFILLKNFYSVMLLIRAKLFQQLRGGVQIFNLFIFILYSDFECDIILNDYMHMVSHGFIILLI